MISLAVCPEVEDPSPYVIEYEVELPIYVDDNDGLNKLLFDEQTEHCVV